MKQDTVKMRIRIKTSLEKKTTVNTATEICMAEVQKQDEKTQGYIVKDDTE